MSEEKSEVFRSSGPNEKAVAQDSDAKRKKPLDGPAPELRQITDHNATGTAGVHELGEIEIGRHTDEAKHNDVEAKHDDAIAATAAVVAKPEVTALLKKDDAIPWALSLHLEERIKGLGSKTAVVNKELDALEAAAQKLAKRIGT